jgi:hypothetical protein
MTEKRGELMRFRRRRRWLRIVTAVVGALVAAGVYVMLAHASDCVTRCEQRGNSSQSSAHRIVLPANGHLVSRCPLAAN